MNEGYLSENDPDVQLVIALRNATPTLLETLREKKEREDPKPLTLEELREMQGEPVWKDDTKEWVIVDGFEEITWGCGGCECIFMDEEEREAQPIYYRTKSEGGGE